MYFFYLNTIYSVLTQHKLAPLEIM